MKISTSTLALLCLAGFASAQTKGPAPVKDPNAGGYFPPPSGTSFLVAGGSDDCANAATNDAISGYGTFAVTNVGATNGTPDAAGCNTNLDVWFYWTATASGNTIVSLCGGVTADTYLTVWNAPSTSCPTTSVACNDDSCGLQSQITFNATAGNSYFFQMGAFGAATTYSGTFTVAPPPTPPVNDDCATPIAISGPGVYPFNNGAATTGTQGQAEAICLFFSTTAIQKDSWWTYTATANGTATVSVCGQVVGGTDTKMAVYAGTGCPAGAALACNDDNAACTGQTLSSELSFAVVCGQAYTIQLGSYSAAASLSGTFTVTEVGTACGPAGVPYCFGDGTGTACPCANNGAAGNGCANSIDANGGNLATTGNASVSADTLVLVGTGMPNSSALYFQGTAQISAAFGDGLRCAGGSVIRLGTKNNLSGASSYPVPGDQSVSVRGLVSAGDARTYQCWYRNAAAFCTASTFNLTNGVAVTWGS